MNVDSPELTGSQARTRAAILQATASVLARDRTATLPQIAAAAQVARSTLHRYFADRDRLIYETTLDSIRVISGVIGAAATAEGPARDAMRRVITTLAPEGDRIVFLFADPAVLRDIPAEQLPDSAPILELIVRGQQEGVFDAELTPEWIRIALFGPLVKACGEAAHGMVPRHSIVPSLIRIFERGVAIS
ncbi:TetR/AcrR family transcriptional regulator [Mycolicibacter senuensis]|uniref:TetR family transcriptional regulator n=1 Tax=Mycolicibacter senuensis TaxID=386913 RepID=A0A7I9XMZ5_9MYCO|nr:TetR/AcrR family transcriptional regulator [Mycolicibacter senuensis]MDQ2628137.1 TetR/AcrR family transcriptional regulator [Actinomycetota bacterium]GFG71355.1 TetR family transcriptional regulator [Mycolicibacter senuensis]